MRIRKYKEEGKVIVFTDESGFVHSAPRTYGYSARGERCYGVHDWHPSKRTNLTPTVFKSAISPTDLMRVYRYESGN